MSTTTKRAVAIVRVSEVGDRDERLISDDNQRDALERGCAVHALELIGEPYPEINVSGGADLDRRPGLRRALEDIEAGRAEVLVAAHFDRLFRSLTVQQEVVKRVEEAGGHVLSLDTGRVTNGTAGEWLSSSFLGLVSEYTRRSIRERSNEGREAAIARGAYAARTPLGMRREDDGSVSVQPGREAEVIAEAYRHAARGTLRDATEHLREQLPVRRWDADSTRRLLRCAAYRGSSIASIALWEAAQTAPRARAANGAYPLSNIATCAVCGGGLVGHLKGDRNGTKTRNYRCANDGCPTHPSIYADRLEEHVRGWLTFGLRRLGEALQLAAGAEGLAEAVAELEALVEDNAAFSADLDYQRSLRPEARRAQAREWQHRIDAAEDRVRQLSRRSEPVKVPSVAELATPEGLALAARIAVDAGLPIALRPGHGGVAERVPLIPIVFGDDGDRHPRVAAA